jgi:hypothetical protein
MTTMKQELKSPHSMVELTLEVSLFESPVKIGDKEISHRCGLFFSLSVEGYDRATSRFPVYEVPSVIAALRKAIQVITNWEGLSLPGEISETIHERREFSFPRVTAKTKGEHRWIQWMDGIHPEFGPSIWVNLSLDQVKGLISQLEQVPSLEQQMIETLKSLP